MAKIKRVKYFTQDKLDLINQDNWNKYQKYLRSNIVKNKDVKETTYKVYENYFKHFLVYIAEEWDNIDLYSEDFMENAIDIMEGYMLFCQDTLYNNKKVINTKLSAVSSFYHWSVKRREITYHPFDKRLDRMKGANEEKIINSYFLTEEQIEEINQGLDNNEGFDIQDKILFNLSIDSANRIGAISKLTLSSMDLENCMFCNIREKRGKIVEVICEEETIEIIKKWLEIRKETMDNLEVDALFISKYGGEYRPMTKSTLQRRVNKIGKIIGIDDYHSHCNRKTTINLITEKTGDISLAAEIANHNSIEVTRASYIKPVTKAQTRDKIKQIIKEKELQKSKIK